jgi:adenosylcobinamide-GDP ribazoletransferase
MRLGSPAPAVRLLTRLPLPASVPDDAGSIAASVPYFPLVGLAIGAALALLDALLRPVLQRGVVDALLLVALAAITGGFHLDGLMDSADGLLSSAAPERRLEIMRDSHVGAFGVAALALALLVQFAALGALPAEGRAATLLLFGLASRWGIVVMAAAVPYPRPSGMGKAIRAGAGPPVLVTSSLLAALLAWAVAGTAGLVLLLLAAVGFLSLGTWSTRQIGGATGDVYGAGVVLSETLVLLAAPQVLHGAP